MSDPPLSDIDFKNKMTWVWTTLKFRVSFLKWWSSFRGIHSETNQIINRDFTRHKVLPSGIGHTTSCFLSVEGSNKPAPYIVTEEGETMEIEKVQQLGRFSKKCFKLIGQGLNFIGRASFWKPFKANALSQNQQRLRNDFKSSSFSTVLSGGNFKNRIGAKFENHKKRILISQSSLAPSPMSIIECRSSNFGFTWCWRDPWPWPLDR